MIKGALAMLDRQSELDDSDMRSGVLTSSEGKILLAAHTVKLSIN
jgi:hypothetical protein